MYDGEGDSEGFQPDVQSLHDNRAERDKATMRADEATHGTCCMQNSLNQSGNNVSSVQALGNPGARRRRDIFPILRDLDRCSWN